MTHIISLLPKSRANYKINTNISLDCAASMYDFIHIMQNIFINKFYLSVAALKNRYVCTNYRT